MNADQTDMKNVLGSYQRRSAFIRG